jgi:transposase
MRTLKLHFPEQALPTLETFLKQTKEARVFRRAQAVCEVVKGHRLQTVSDSLHFTYAALRKWVHRFANQGVQGLVDRPRPGRPPKVTCALAQHLDRLVDHDPLQHGSSHSQWSCQELATVLGRQTGVRLSRESVREVLKKKDVSYSRPTGRLAPAPAELAWASLELAALEYRARRGEIILLYEDETVLWRFALPRAGWWRKAQRARLPTRPMSQSQIKRDESLKRQAWLQYRSWSRITSGVLLSVIGAVQYGTSKVFYKIVPHFDTEGLRQYIHQVMALFRHTGKEVVMVADRSGIHRAKKLASTLTHWHEQCRLHLLPAHCGHHLNPIEGFWRVLKDRIGAGRCFPDLPQLYQRTRRVLMAHQARPIYAFHW